MIGEDRQRARRRGVGAAMASLRGNPAFRSLWLSNLFFFGGVWTQTLVLGWLAFDMTHSDFAVAVFTAARLAPMLLGPVAGAFADRHNRVVLLMVMCGWAVIVVSVVASFASAGILSYWGLVAGGFAIGLAQSPSQPARASLVLDLVGTANLSNANALNALALNVTQVIGPAIGGAMIAALGAPAALWISTAWYALSLVLLLPLRRVRQTRHAEHEPVLAMVASGLRVIGRNRIAVAVLLVTVAANILLWPIYQSFMPVFADERLQLDAAGLGALLTFAGVGGLIGSLIIAAMGDFRRKGALFVFGTMAWAVCWAVFSQLQWPPAAFALMALIGLASAAFGVLQTTLLLLATEPAVHGRALGVQELAIGVMPVATLGLGAIADRVGVAMTTLVAAILLIVALIVLVLRVPRLLKVGEPDAGARATEAAEDARAGHP